MVTNVTRMAKPVRVDVLRLWSQRAARAAGVSTGFPDARFGVRGQRAGISQSSRRHFRSTSTTGPILSKRGRLELRGCSVGVGDDGPKLMRALAELIGTDVYAALNAQPIGPIQWAGPVVRMRPDGSSTTGRARISGNGCHRQAPATAPRRSGWLLDAAAMRRRGKCQRARHGGGANVANLPAVASRCTGVNRGLTDGIVVRIGATTNSSPVTT